MRPARNTAHQPHNTAAGAVQPPAALDYGRMQPSGESISELAATLPVVRHRDQILRQVTANPVVVVESPTGSGKTTQLPRILYDAGYADAGRIGVTQPRRIAAVSVTDFIQAQLAADAGAGAGAVAAYKMRFEDTTTRDTRIKVMTDGVLLQELGHDRLLGEYSVMMVDEAHERSLNIDFVLGLLKGVLAQRPTSRWSSRPPRSTRRCSPSISTPARSSASTRRRTRYGSTTARSNPPATPSSSWRPWNGSCLKSTAPGGRATSWCSCRANAISAAASRRSPRAARAGAGSSCRCTPGCRAPSRTAYSRRFRAAARSWWPPTSRRPASPSRASAT